ncbi:MAG: YtxH domain-containing protein [Chitinophagaceae bacterium]|nr:YtxH domain-containing protein [Chitinophagaceae bacterium]
MMTSNTKIILGILGAVATGAVVGLLMAPEKGRDTRKKISHTANDWGKQLGDLFAATKFEANDLKDKAYRKAGELRNQASHAANTIKER